MKEYKQKVIDALVAESHEKKIVNLKETARAAGIDRLTAADAREVLVKAAGIAGYRVALILPGERTHASFWEHGEIIAPDVRFEG